jgi:hypothetical protein
MTGTRTVRVHRDDDHKIRMIVAGEYGAVEYHLLAEDGDPLGIEYHSPRPRYEGDEPQRCDILEGFCYPEGTSAGAVDLCREYQRSGGDEEVIWRELETLYARWAEEA